MPKSRGAPLKDVCVRGIPCEIKARLEREAHSRNTSQNELMVKILVDAVTNGIREKPAAYGNAAAAPRSLGNSQFPFTFIDLFAGIGGFRLALEKAGGRCLFTSEWDKHSQKTYMKWFGDSPAGDITKISPRDIPDHHILAAGFPCQPFSIAGVSKKNSLGRQHGFKDKTQGTLFFHVASIAEIKRPPILFLENVKNLVSHDSEKTWNVIRSTLDELGYRVFHKIIDAKHWVPQHRERIFIVCFDKKVFGADVRFDFPHPPDGPAPKLRDILDATPDPKYTLTDHLWNYLQRYAEKHKEKGNGFGFGLADVEGISGQLSERYFKDGSEILIPQGEGKNPRRLTPRECARLMGFDDRLPIVVSDTQAYRQFGQATVVSIAESIACSITKMGGFPWKAARKNGRVTSCC